MNKQLPSFFQSTPRKSYLILLFAFVLSMHLSAQIPNYFGNDPEWRMQSAVGWVGPCLETTDYVVYVSDTITIGAYNYYTIKKRGTVQYTIMAPPGCTQSDSYFDYNYTYLRQDGRKIYAYNSLGDELLWDFGLNVGDTLAINNMNPTNDQMVVTSIDSILVGSEYRRVLNISGNPDLAYIVEGIGQAPGYTGGLLDQFPGYFESYFRFICYSQNDSTLLGETTSMECFFNMSTEEEISSQSLHVYPNPATDFITISIDEYINSGFSYSLYNVVGEKIRVGSALQNNFQLDVSSLTAGVYFLEINMDGICVKKKIVKR